MLYAPTGPVVQGTQNVFLFLFLSMQTWIQLFTSRPDILLFYFIKYYRAENVQAVQASQPDVESCPATVNACIRLFLPYEVWSDSAL